MKEEDHINNSTYNLLLSAISADELRLEDHAVLRGVQRRISSEEMLFVTHFGRPINAGRAVHYFFGKKEVEQCLKALEEYLARLDGTVVVLSKNEAISTTYRNKKALRYIRKKRT